MRLNVYVPKLAAVPAIQPGAGIIGSPRVDHPGKLLIDYEDNHASTVNIRYADRLAHAADRHLSGYPTSNRLLVDADELLLVGTFDTHTQRGPPKQQRGARSLAGRRAGGHPGSRDPNPSDLPTALTPPVVNRPARRPPPHPPATRPVSHELSVLLVRGPTARRPARQLPRLGAAARWGAWAADSTHRTDGQHGGRQPRATPMEGKEMPLYAAGHNQPGHLPDYRGEGTLLTRQWRRARDHLVEDLRDAADATQTWADPHDCDDIPCPTYGDDCPDNLAADLRMAADEAADLRPDNSWRAMVAGQAWWLADLGGHCPDCGYPLAERDWPELHRRPADGHSCDLELDDDPAP